MFASAFLPTDSVNIYRTAADELYLVGTAEVSLAALHMEEILDEGSLPLRYVGYSTCFRREAGSYGKDLGGMFRVHQFDKVEMFWFATPEASWDEHEYLVSIEEGIIGGRGPVPHRQHRGGRSGRCCGQEVRPRSVAPGPGALSRAHVVLELHRLRCPARQTRVRRPDGTVETLHTLNGTATAIGRTLIAILENNQQADGSVVIPERLWQFLPERARVLKPKG